MKTAIALAALLGASAVAFAQDPHKGHDMGDMKKDTKLQPPPADLPKWMASKTADEVFYKAAPYNYAVYKVPKLAYDLNAVATGHAMAYEDLVTGKAKTLETATFDRINWVLNHPPRLMPDESSISPSFRRLYTYLEKIFDWAHILHAQTIDTLADPRMTDEQKDKEIDALWKYYNEMAPYTVTGKPMNMAFLDMQAYSGGFRKKHPKVNGLFWGYHWLQTTMYDMLWHAPASTHVPQYDLIGQRYREVELYRTDRDFMPMMAETSPRFAKRYPDMANSFDNLHMLHDMVNDTLVMDGLTTKQKEEQIKRAIWMVTSSTHADCKPGEGEPNTLHDHRYPMGMPGMGMMLGSDEEIMYMPGMGWMNMSECGHCSIPLPEENPWGATVSVEGWTMEVRCLMCARDMSAETPGRAIIRAATEDPRRTLVLISDDEGNWTSSIEGVVFLEVQAEHPECSSWSRAFTSRLAFDEYVKANEEYKGAKPLSLTEWAALDGGRPETYRRIDKPNPYRKDGGNPPPTKEGK